MLFLFLYVALFSLLVIGGFAQPTMESEELDLSFTDEAIDFLRRNGIEDADEIILARRSRNVSECFEFAHTTERIIRLCATRTAYYRCQNDSEVLHYKNCRGRRCIAQLSPEISRCTVERLGVQFPSGSDAEDAFCGLPAIFRRLNEWQTPLWARTVGDNASVACLLALPEGATFEWRVGCEAGEPLGEYSVLFPSSEILGRNTKRVRCVTEQACGLPDLLTARIVCYRSLEDFEDDDDEEDIITETPYHRQHNDDDENSSSILSNFLIVISSLTLFFLCNFC